MLIIITLLFFHSVSKYAILVQLVRDSDRHISQYSTNDYDIEHMLKIIILLYQEVITSST